MTAGYVAQSSGMMADALDMGTDARHFSHKKTATNIAAVIEPPPSRVVYFYLPRAFPGPMSPGRTSEPVRAGAAFVVSVDGFCSITVLPFALWLSAASASLGTVALLLSRPNCAAELASKPVPS